MLIVREMPYLCRKISHPMQCERGVSISMMLGLWEELGGMSQILIAARYIRFLDLYYNSFVSF